MGRPVLVLAVLALSLALTACQTGLRDHDEAPLAAAPASAAPAPAGDGPADLCAYEAGPAVPRTLRASKRPTVLERTAAEGRRVRPTAEPVPRRAWFVLTPEHPSAPADPR
jgi:hypothetical protein